MTLSLSSAPAELFASRTHSESGVSADSPTAKPMPLAPTPAGLEDSDARTSESDNPGEGGESVEMEEEEEGEGVWLRLYLKASDQAADGASRQRLARLAAALNESSASSAWFTRYGHG